MHFCIVKVYTFLIADNQRVNALFSPVSFKLFMTFSEK